MAESEQLAKWLAAVAAGDQRAFKKLYEATSPHLFALLLRILKTQDNAEDALQDVYVKIWQKAKTYELKRGAPLGWLMSIARYRALDLLRRRDPEITMPDDPELVANILSDTHTAGPLVNSETMQGLSNVNRCMQSLRPEQRRSLLMVYYEGLTHQEVSDRLNVPLGTAKSLVRRGLISLRSCLANISDTDQAED